MKTLILYLCVTFSLITETYAQQTNVEMPDYTNWAKTADHSENFLYGGVEIALRDQHYIIRREKVDYALVYFTPEDSNKMWFAIHMIYDEHIGTLHGFLFERKEESWLFIQNLSRNDLNDMAIVFKSRYDLIKK